MELAEWIVDGARSGRERLREVKERKRQREGEVGMSLKRGAHELDFPIFRYCASVVKMIAYSTFGIHFGEGWPRLGGGGRFFTSAPLCRRPRRHKMEWPGTKRGSQRLLDDSYNRAALK